MHTITPDAVIIGVDTHQNDQAQAEDDNYEIAERSPTAGRRNGEAPSTIAASSIAQTVVQQSGLSRCRSAVAVIS
jgi:hypothetical protein